MCMYAQVKSDVKIENGIINCEKIDKTREKNWNGERKNENCGVTVT